MNYRKITPGFVVQVFEDDECLKQSFVADGQVRYEDMGGNNIPPRL